MAACVEITQGWMTLWHAEAAQRPPVVRLQDAFGPWRCGGVVTVSNLTGRWHPLLADRLPSKAALQWWALWGPEPGLPVNYRVSTSHQLGKIQGHLPSSENLFHQNCQDILNLQLLFIKIWIWIYMEWGKFEYRFKYGIQKAVQQFNKRLNKLPHTK